MANHPAPPNQIYITDAVLRAIDQEIVSRPPEQGGALLGPPGFPAVSRFIYDPWARATGASYFPSDKLSDLVPQLEIDEGLEFKGIVHSHPGGMGHPSGQDIRGPFTRALNENPHLSYFLGPIVTHNERSSNRDPHRVKCGRGTIAFYIAYRGQSEVSVEPIRCEIVAVHKLAEQMRKPAAAGRSTTSSLTALQQLTQDLRQVVAFFNIGDSIAIVPMEVDQKNVYGVQIPLSPTVELTIHVGDPYPFIPPIAVVSTTGSDGRKQLDQLQLAWDLRLPPSERLATALREYFSNVAPQKKTYGPNSGLALTEDPDVAHLAGWRALFTGGELASEALYDDLLKRSVGILSQSIASRRVLVVGLGSVGSYLSELLVRSGIGRMTVVDPEAVEAVNLSRTAYDVGDIGKPKVDALARRLLNVSPAVQLIRHAVDLTTLSVEELDRLVTGADLVLAATDDLEAQRALNRFAYARGKPAVFVGIWAGANGGEVIYTLPEVTSCYLCSTRSRAALGEAAPKIDYGTGRLVGEVALATDIQHVSSIAEKVALSLLLLPDAGESKLKEFIKVPASQGKSFIAVGNAPDFWVFPELMADALGQYAYQSLWIRVDRQPDCQVCGKDRLDPLTVPMKSPTLADLQDIDRARREASA